jgi:hypothetical protein
MDPIVIKLLTIAGLYLSLGIIFIIILGIFMITVEYRSIVKKYKIFDKDIFKANLKDFYNLNAIALALLLWPALGLYVIGHIIWISIENKISKINILEIVANKLEKIDRKRNPQNYI